MRLLYIKTQDIRLDWLLELFLLNRQDSYLKIGLLFIFTQLTAIWRYWYPSFGTKSFGSAVLLESFKSHVICPDNPWCGCTLTEKQSGMFKHSSWHLIGWSTVTVFITWFRRTTFSSFKNRVILQPLHAMTGTNKSRVTQVIILKRDK